LYTSINISNSSRELTEKLINCPHPKEMGTPFISALRVLIKGGIGAPSANKSEEFVKLIKRTKIVKALKMFFEVFIVKWF